MRGFSLIVVGLTLLGMAMLVGAEPQPRAETPSTAWGKPDCGLQAGIRPAANPQQVSAGIAKEFEIVIRNVQASGTIVLCYPAGTWYSGEAEKSVVEVGCGGIGGKPSTEYVHLEPGQDVVIGRLFLGSPGAKINDAFLTELPTGLYQVGSERVLPPAEIVPPIDGITHPGARYCPALRTGYLDVELKAASPLIHPTAENQSNR